MISNQIAYFFFFFLGHFCFVHARYTCAGSAYCSARKYTTSIGATLVQKKILGSLEKTLVSSSANQRKNNLTFVMNDENIEKALQEFARFFPELENDIKENKAKLISELKSNPPHPSCGKAEGIEKCPLLNTTLQNEFALVSFQSNADRGKRWGNPGAVSSSSVGHLALGMADTCGLAIIKVIVDVVFLILSFLGLPAAFRAGFDAKVMAKLGAEGIEVLKPGVISISKASGGMDQAWKVYAVGKDAYHRGILTAAIRSAFDSMSFLQKLAAGGGVFFTVASWFASGGLALALEVINAGIMLTMLVADSVAAAKSCAPPPHHYSVVGFYHFLSTYTGIQASKSNEDMNNFIRTYVNMAGGTIENEASLSEIVPSYSGVSASKSMLTLGVALGTATWVRDMYSRNVEPEEETCQAQGGFLRLMQEESRSDALALHWAPTLSAIALDFMTRVGCSYKDYCKQQAWSGESLAIFCHKNYFDEDTCKCDQTKHCHIAFSFDLSLAQSALTNGNRDGKKAYEIKLAGGVHCYFDVSQEPIGMYINAANLGGVGAWFNPTDQGFVNNCKQQHVEDNLLACSIGWRMTDRDIKGPFDWEARIEKTKPGNFIDPR